MKKSAGLLILLVATVCFARTRDWKAAAVIGVSESSVSGPLLRSSTTVHYMIETDDMVLLLDYTYHPSAKASSDEHSKNSPPSLAVNVTTKIAIEGRHAYILDNTGTEVKMHIVKKTTK